MLSTAWRADAARGPAASAAGVLSLVLATAPAAFFVIYTSAFTTAFAAMELIRVPEGAPGHEEAEQPAMAGLATYLVPTVLLLVPLLLMARRRTVPLGSATARLGLAVSDGVRRPVELWSGVVLLSTGVAVVLGHLFSSGGQPAGR